MNKGRMSWLLLQKHNTSKMQGHTQHETGEQKDTTIISIASRQAHKSTRGNKATTTLRLKELAPMTCMSSCAVYLDIVDLRLAEQALGGCQVLAKNRPSGVCCGTT